MKYYRCIGLLWGVEPKYFEYELKNTTPKGVRLWLDWPYTTHTKFVQESRWREADGRCFARPTKAQAFQDYLDKLRHKISEAERVKSFAEEELAALERLKPDGTAPLLLLTAPKTRQLFLGLPPELVL